MTKENLLLYINLKIFKIFTIGLLNAVGLLRNEQIPIAIATVLVMHELIGLSQTKMEIEKER